MWRRRALIALVLPLVSVALEAQVTGLLVGTIRTADGDPVPGAVVTVTGTDRPVTVTTDAEGNYRAPDLWPGRYTLTIEAPPFVREPIEVVVIGGATVRQNLTLRTDAEEPVEPWRADRLLGSSLGLSGTVFEAGEVDARHASLARLIELVPGITVGRAGGVGQPVSVRVRGAEVRDRFVLADGLAVDDPGRALDVRGPLDPMRVEVVRGVGSSAYGGELGGFAHQITRLAGDPDTARVSGSVEGGDPAWQRIAASATGRRAAYDWSAGVQHLDTDNEQPNGDFRQTAVAGSFGAERPRSSLRISFQGETSRIGSPGPTLLVRPDLDAHEERTRLVSGATFRLAQGRRGEHEVRAVVSHTDRLRENRVDSGAFELFSRTEDIVRIVVPDFPRASGLRNKTQDMRLTYEYTHVPDEFHFLTVGGSAQREAGRFETDETTDDPDKERYSFAAYVEDRIRMQDNLTVTVGGRFERSGDFGFSSMPRGSAVWSLGRGFSVHGSAGFGVTTPTPGQLFGGTFDDRANPRLELARSRAFDAGIEQSLGRRGRIDLTAYRHNYEGLLVAGDVELPRLEQLPEFQRLTLAERAQFREQIRDGLRAPPLLAAGFDETRARLVNLERSRAQGVEVTLETTPIPQVNVTATYAFTDSLVTEGTALIETGEPLPGVPRHQGAVTGGLSLGPVAVGATFTYVGDRTPSVSFFSYALGIERLAAYRRWDARGRIRLSNRLEISVAGENLTDRAYEEVLGYPALGRLIRAGLRVSY